MSLHKRGKYWFYDFTYKGTRKQGSTGQSNINKAKLTEAKIRSGAALEYHGIAAPKIAPYFKDFMEGRFVEYVKEHNKAKPLTIKFYSYNAKRLVEFEPFKTARLDAIDEDLAAQYASWRLKQTKRSRGKGTIAPSAVNRELATLRKAILLAYEWRLITRRPRFHLLPSTKGREFVLSGELEKVYLSLCPEPLKSAAILMLDAGLRPEECVSLRKSDISCDGSLINAPKATQMTPERNHVKNLGMFTPGVTADTLCIRDGKTANAARILPLTDRAKAAIELLCALWPESESEWLFPGRKEGSHLRRSSLDQMHGRVRSKKVMAPYADITPSIEVLMVKAKMTTDTLFPNEFVLYSLRHTFGTRLAESGASAWDIQKAMGHSSIVISEKYVHISGDRLRLAMRQKELFDKTLRGEVHPDTSQVSKT